MTGRPARFLAADLARVVRVLEKRGHKVRKVRITREGAEVFVDDAGEPVAATTREELATEPAENDPNWRAPDGSPPPFT